MLYAILVLQTNYIYFYLKCLIMYFMKVCNACSLGSIIHIFNNLPDPLPK